MDRQKAVRKLRKLYRNPNLFFHDMLEKRMAGRVGGQKIETFSPSAGKYVSLVKLKLDGVRTHARFSTEALLPRSRFMPLVVRDRRDHLLPALLAETLEQAHPGTFELQQTRFLDIEFGPEASSWSMHRQLSQFSRNQLSPHVWPIARLRGFMLCVDPQCATAFLLRAAWPDFRLITVLDEEPARGDPVWDHLQYSDVVMCRESLSRQVLHPNVMIFADAIDLALCLKATIQTLTPRAPDVMLPILYKADERVPDDRMAELAHWDAFVRIAKHPMEYARPATPFVSAIEAMHRDIDVFLLRESFANRYASCVERGDSLTVLKLALRDGAKVSFQVGPDWDSALV